ncbi:hypothetical protein [Schaalia vaccimaxillae]|uniref:putative acetyltransferase n=1 Tax=Schaalia vaccimaxillae TaxID=183916 RepID=UPI0013F3AE03|nr:hypothetical protein [Schaalia vaccimaxillae]
MTQDAHHETSTGEAKHPSPLPWMQWRVGERVVLRYRLADGLHDALGQVVEVATGHVTIETRRGVVRVDAETMVTGKRVPEAPLSRSSGRDVRGPRP